MNCFKLLSAKLLFFVFLTLISTEASFARSNSKNKNKLRKTPPETKVTIYLADFDREKQTNRQKIQEYFSTVSFLPYPNDLKWPQYFNLRPHVVKFKELKYDRMVCYSPEVIIVVINRPYRKALTFCLPKSKYDVSKPLVLTFQTLVQMEIENSHFIVGSPMLDVYSEGKDYTDLVNEDKQKLY